MVPVVSVVSFKAKYTRNAFELPPYIVSANPVTPIIRSLVKDVNPEDERSIESEHMVLLAESLKFALIKVPLVELVQ